MKQYRVGLDAWALLLFAAVMLPNVFWFAFPAPNDILRQTSKTPVLGAAVLLVTKKRMGAAK